MTTWHRNQGDVGGTINPILDGVQDLSTATGVSATVELCGDPTYTASLSGTIIDATLREISIDLASWITTATPGQWEVRFHVAWGGTILSWPAAPHMDYVIVHE